MARISFQTTNLNKAQLALAGGCEQDFIPDF